MVEYAQIKSFFEFLDFLLESLECRTDFLQKAFYNLVRKDHYINKEVRHGRDGRS